MYYAFWDPQRSQYLQSMTMRVNNNDNMYGGVPILCNNNK